jgi:hypothetical protein
VGERLRETRRGNEDLVNSPAVHAENRSLQRTGLQQPDPQTEDLYIKSINTTVDQYRRLLGEVRIDTLVLANCDFDTGQPTNAAEYSLTDDTYAKLLARLSQRKFDLTSPELRANILQFYSDLSVPIETKKDGVLWQSVLTDLDQLKAVVSVQSVASSPAR